MTAHYKIALTVDSDRFRSMSDLLDTVCNALEARGVTEDEYRAEVHGPPELNIGLRMKW